jgi:acetyl-CoA synthetase
LQLAAARLGAVFSVVFAGFSAEALAGRIADSSPKMVITCSAVKRASKHIELKKIVDEVRSGQAGSTGSAVC